MDEPRGKRRSSSMSGAEVVALVQTAIEGVTFGGRLLGWARSKESTSKPLRYSILACEQKDQHIQIEAEVLNAGRHAVYIQSITVAEPFGINVIESYQLRRKEEEQIGFGDHGSDSRKVIENALKISPDGIRKLQVNIQLFETGRLLNYPYGMLRFSYVVAGVARSNLCDAVEFCLMPGSFQ